MAFSYERGTPVWNHNSFDMHRILICTAFWCDMESIVCLLPRSRRVQEYLKTGALLRAWEEEEEVTWVQFSPVNNSIVATVCSDDKSGETLNTSTGCEFAAFSSDGRTIATASAAVDAHDLLLVDAETGTVWLTLADHQELISPACFSVDDGSKLASVSKDGTCNSRVRYSHRGGARCARAQLHVQGVGLVDRSTSPNYQRWRPNSRSLVGARLGAGHAEGCGVREGAPPAARGEVGGAGAGRGGGADDPGLRVMVGSTKFPERTLLCHLEATKIDFSKMSRRYRGPLVYDSN